MCPQKASAFTLIEHLVVIDVIAILAAILFPVFAQAREKQLMYMNDYDQQLFFRVNTANPPTSTRCATGWVTSKTDPAYFKLQWWNLVLPYIKNTQVFTCPSDPGPITLSPDDSGNNTIPRSYIASNAPEFLTDA